MDKDFPVFVLVFVVCDQHEYTDVLIPGFTRFKVTHVGHDGVILHSRDIRKALGDFAFLQVPEKREMFHEELNRLMAEAQFQLIAIAIDKRRYGGSERNPYELALEFGMWRLKQLMEERVQSDITLLAEARGKNEDDALRLAFLQLLKTSSFAPIEFDLKFVSKKANVLGHQIADLCAYPIARHVIDEKKSHRAFEIVRTKFIDRSGFKIVQ